MKLRNAILATAATMTLGACATTGPGNGYGGGYGNGGYNNGGYGNGGYNNGYCADCGVVTRIDAGQSTAPSATGAVIGGLVGAVAAHEIAKNRTHSEGKQNAAAIAAAVGGAVAGNAIQNRVQNAYNVTVRMDDGRIVTVSQADIGGIREGSSVRVYNGRAWAR